MKLKLSLAIAFLSLPSIAQEIDLDSKKMIVSLIYNQYASVYQNKNNAEPIDFGPSFNRKFSPKKGFANPVSESERIKLELSKMKFSSKNHSGNAYFDVPSSIFPNEDIEYKLNFHFDKIVNQKGENIVEPLSEKIYDNSGINIRTRVNDDVDTFSINLLNEDEEVPLYSVSGKLLLNLSNNIEEKTFDISNPFTFENAKFSLIKKEKNFVHFQVDGDIEAFNISYLNNAGETGSFSSAKIDLENPIIKYFIEQNKLFSEAELAEYASKLNIEDLKNTTKVLNKTLISVESNIDITKINISNKAKMSTFELPFEIKSKGVALLGKPLQIGTLLQKSFFRETDNYEEKIADETDVNTIKQLVIGVFDLESNTENFKSYLLFDELPVETSKFKALEKLSLRLSKKADWAKFFNQLSKFEALQEVTIKGFEETNKEGDEVFNKVHSLPAEIGKLQGLTTLNFQDHFLEKLPDTFKNLQDLTFLNFSNNALITFPEQILTLGKLEVLDLTDNFISEIPETVCQLKNLRTIKIGSNRLKSIPTCLNSLENLEEISLENNYLGEFIKKNEKVFLNNSKITGGDSQEESTPLEENQKYINAKESMK